MLLPCCKITAPLSQSAFYLQDHLPQSLFQHLIVDAPSLEVFKARLDGVLDSLVYYKRWRLAALPEAGALEFDHL